MDINIPVMILLLLGLVVSALACVMIRDMLKASIALSVVSGILSVIMFLLNAHLAAVFELSVCTGLITVVFISAISMTRVLSKEELAERERLRRKRFALLPVLLLALLAGTLFYIGPRLKNMTGHAAPMGVVAGLEMFWNNRQADLLGQIIIILAGVYGVLIFFKERGKE